MPEQGKFRILVLLGSIPLYGQERGNIEAMRALVESGTADVLFVTHAEWGHLAIQPELDRLGLPWTVARYTGLFGKGMGGTKWLRNISNMLIGSWQLRSIVRQFKPTHLHTCNSLYFVNFLPYLFFSRLPMVYRIGDQPSLHNAAHRFLWRKLIVPKVSHFVAISNFIKKCLLEVPAQSEKISVIYNQPPQRGTSYRNDDSIPHSHGQTILYVGQISRDKGVDLLVEAARTVLGRYPVATFHFAGDYSWDNPFAEELINEISLAGLNDRIRFLGYRDDVVNLIDQADLHVCPSVCNEALGNVVVEAKRAGRASIVFPSGGLPELIRHDVDGYVCPEKTSGALVTALDYYLSDASRVIEHGKAAHSSLEEIFEMSKFADKWAQVYREAKPECT